MSNFPDGCTAADLPRGMTDAEHCAYWEGREAWGREQAGGDDEDNPYRGTDLADLWQDGYDDAEQEGK